MASEKDSDGNLFWSDIGVIKKAILEQIGFKDVIPWFVNKTVKRNL